MLNRVFLNCERGFGCLALALVLVVVLAVPGQYAAADPGDTEFAVVELSTCPSPTYNNCPTNNTNPGGCSGIACGIRNRGLCWCVYGTSTCNCP